MDLNRFTHAVVNKLGEETAFLDVARAADGEFQKRRQGVFSYTCGGAHLLQGAGYAVASGLGEPADRQAMLEAARLQAWRFPRELKIRGRGRSYSRPNMRCC